MIADNFDLESPEHCRPVEEEQIASSSLNYDFILNDEGNNSKGLSQPLLLSEEDEDEHAAATDNDNSGGVGKDDAKLLLSFFLMLIVGTLNKIFQKLQAIVSTTFTHHALHFTVSMNKLTNQFSIHTASITSITANVQLSQQSQSPPKLHLCPPLLPLHPSRINIRFIQKCHPSRSILHEQTTLRCNGTIGLYDLSTNDICRSLFTRIVVDTTTAGGDTHFDGIIQSIQRRTVQTVSILWGCGGTFGYRCGTRAFDDSEAC